MTDKEIESNIRFIRGNIAGWMNGTNPNKVRDSKEVLATIIGRMVIDSYSKEYIWHDIVDVWQNRFHENVLNNILKDIHSNIIRNKIDRV